MNSILLALFTMPMTITGIGRLLMLLPLTLTISVVYKTLHCRRPASIPRAALTLWLTIVAAMMSIGLVLLVVFRALA